ncbi:hypothetical protein EV382_5087 [Micromonospora violae]|uniref:Uncharacterized protein n=1 Tax=Micromonospora violae TaxID=1278207 RepID=A0A4Q7UK59_9ACTN|nr:hypothetical protein [Micromonospora violae]RZT81795.1 hypothetical protein EV382_5087 [Micromonospora violae]
MTTEGFREVDVDLLADYLGGALDGTPQQDEVAQLVAADPSWAEAYALLAPAVAEVRTDLARWAEPSPEMPSAITDRLLAALAAEPTNDDSTEEAPGVAPGGEAATPVVVPAQGGRRPAAPTPVRSGRWASTGPGRRRSGWARRGAPVAAAVIAVLAVSLGLNQLSRGSEDAGGTSAMDQPVNAPDAAAGAAPFRTTASALRSGTNYTPETLGSAHRTDASSTPATSRATGATPSQQPEVDAEGERRPSPTGSDQLARLTDETALTTCLASIATEHGTAPLMVELIDYARFQGEQALIIRFTDANGVRWAWVSGPECGVPGSGSDSRYWARVG